MKITDLKEKEVIQCETEAEAIRVCKLMHESGQSWATGKSYLNYNYWTVFKGNTCYNPNNNTFSNWFYYVKENYSIYNSSKFPSNDSIDPVNHPGHYGGSENPYEAIKVINSWGLGFALGNTVKYISRAGKKDPDKELEDLKKAAWYLKHHISNKEDETAGHK